MSGAPEPILPERATAFLAPIESLRGFAALAVAWGHCEIVVAFRPHPLPGALERGLEQIVFEPMKHLWNGRAAVLVFFVISGLVLSLALDQRPLRGSLRRFVGFVGRRALRIYPAHIAALILFVPFAFLLFRLPLADAAAFAASGQGINPWLNGAAYGHLAPWPAVESALLYSNYYNPVTWTLKVEILGSLLLPLFAALTRPGKWSIDLAVLTALVLGTFIIDPAKRPDVLPLYLPAFYLGCMARTHGKRLAERIADIPGAAGSALSISLLLLLLPWAFVSWLQALHFSTLAMTGAAFLLVTMVAWAPGRVGGILLLHPLSRAMGRLSYSFYLWHVLILFAFVRLLFVLVSPETLAGATIPLLILAPLVTIPSAFFIAWLSYRWIERPFIALGRRLSTPRGAAPAAPVGLEAAPSR